MRKYSMFATAPDREFLGDKELRGLTAVVGSESRELCVGSDCVCASACALIWFGAVDRDGAVGLHRPRIDDAGFAALSPAEAAVVYKRVLNDIARYMEAMEVPRPMIDAMVATPSSEIQWVDAKDNLERPPSFAEWQDAACGSFTEQESKTMSDLDVKIISGQQLTPDEVLLRKELHEKLDKRIYCRAELRSARVDQLTPP